MPILWSLATLMGVHLVAVISPGPGFLSVIQTAVRNPRRIMFLHVLGMGLASLTWACGAVFGMQAVLTRAVGLYRVLQIAGGLYLVWVGIQSWRHAKEPIHPPEQAAAEHLRPLEALRRGYATNIANPKVMVFYVSIFTAVLHPGMPGWVRFVALAIMLVDNLAWYGSVGVLLSSPRAQRSYERAKTAIDRTAGSVMLLFGLRLVWGARRGAY